MPLGPLLLLCCATALPGGGETDAYRRVVSQALERAQSKLLGETHVEVDHSRWEDPWVVTSEHYEVRTTRSYLQGRRLADGLELLRAEFVRLLGEGHEPAGKHKVWVLPGIGDYNRFGQQNGAEHSSILPSFYSSQHAERPVVTYQNPNETLLGMWATHGALHQYLEETFGPQSLVWVDEGLASYFALFWDWGYGATNLEKIEKGATWVPLERLLAEPLQAYAKDPDDRSIELGMLFNFLLNHCEATRNGATGDPATGPFQDLLRAAVRGEDVSDSEFLQTFDEAAPLLEDDFKSFDFSKP